LLNQDVQEQTPKKKQNRSSNSGRMPLKSSLTCAGLAAATEERLLELR